jgi:hypothetical protein
MEARKLYELKHNHFGKFGKKFHCTPRDYAILTFLWRWKVASTATVHEAIGRPQSPYATYKALERLELRKLIECKETQDDGVSSWTLTDRGFNAIRSSLGDLCEEGYGTENALHDRNVVAFHLGEWATHQAPIITHFTEQEIRRRPTENYPQWVPNTKAHRPDGYSRIKTENREYLLAFEVELWSKALSHYENTLKFYELMKKVWRVFWLVGDSYAKDQILRARDCIRETSLNYHVFVDLNDYMDNGWDAAVVNERSENLGSIRGTMQEICGGQFRDYLGRMKGQSTVSVHYDPRKVLGKKRTYKPSIVGKLSD